MLLFDDSRSMKYMLNDSKRFFNIRNIGIFQTVRLCLHRDTVTLHSHYRLVAVTGGPVRATSAPQGKYDND